MNLTFCSLTPLCSTTSSLQLLETPVWHINDYMGEMEGADADSEPLTMKECAEMAEKCLFGRSKAVSVSIGNIDEKGAHEVEEVISKHFLKKRPLLDDELPTFRSLKMPNRAEVTKIYGSAPESTEVPLIIEAVAHSEDEENNSLELFIQTASSYELGYEGLVIQELLGSMAYNSAFTQLRTKEQLGYIVSAFVKKSNGGGNAFCVLVQSSNTLPPELEERSLSWIRQFRQEMEEMPDERFKMEAAAVRANLLEKDIKLGEEVSSVWGEILSTVAHGEHFKNPVFDRVEKFANILTLENDDNDQSDTRVFKSASELKKRVLDFYDEYLMTPDRRAVSSRVYNPKGKELFEKNIGKPGVISSYEDAQMVKKHLSTTPTAPYW
jgi:secreted Zn-dependent insulinase-like peptidase